MVFVDTSAWFAYAVPTDPAHDAISRWFTSNRERVITTDYCVDETLTLLCARGEYRRALEVGREFFERDTIQLHFVTKVQIHQAWILFQRRATASWSFTDCTSHVVINALSIRTAVALDVHFRQFGTVQVVP